MELENCRKPRGRGGGTVRKTGGPAPGVDRTSFDLNPIVFEVDCRPKLTCNDIGREIR